MGAGIPADLGGLPSAFTDGRISRIVYEAGDLKHWDTSLLAFVVRLERAAKAHALSISRDALPEGLQRLVDMAFAVPPGSGTKERRSEDGLYVRLGGLVLDIPPRFAELLRFQGALVLSFWRLLRGKSDMRLEDLLRAALECGLHALPIIMLTSTLFGMILAFMGAVQLTRFGAQIYVAGLVGIGMLRVMGPVLVGVVMAGRTGAAYAAIIGTMQVDEEVDALITFGISPMDYLVLPRVLALSLMVPLLTLYADLMGVAGGFLVGVFMLDLPAHAYYQATINAVELRQLLVGLVYATSYGVIVSLCGCYQGMRCGRSAEAVGKAATSAVVSSIVCIILATAIITIFCNLVQI
ncbi:MAG: ABC transporter permease [Deltaproteobacteria bacterium]|nr:ABC transporter permease [Deltaproteobacteria bacterium]